MEDSEFMETEEDKVCPWDYASRDEEFEETNDEDWTDHEEQFEIASNLKRPGGTILRYDGSID